MGLWKLLLFIIVRRKGMAVSCAEMVWITLNIRLICEGGMKIVFMSTQLLSKQ